LHFVSLRTHFVAAGRAGDCDEYAGAPDACSFPSSPEALAPSAAHFCLYLLGVLVRVRLRAGLQVVVAVTLTFPVQFYPAIEVIETRLGMRGSVAGGPQTGGQGSDGGEYALVGSSDAAEEEGEEEEDGDHAAHDEDDDEDGVGSDDERKGMITARTEAEAAGGVAGGDGGGGCWKRLCLRCLCVLFAGGVALAVPNLELVIVR
jgi:hypothetical protein